jgi:hypothetical protein
MEQAFDDQRKKIIKKKYNSDNFNNEVLEIIDGDEEKFTKIFQRFYADIIRDFGSRTYNDIQKTAKGIEPDELKKIEKFDFLTPEIDQYITRTTAEKVVMISNTSKIAIKAIVNEAVALGATINDMKQEIDKLYLDQIIPNRSKTIARTEVVSASNYGSIAGAKQTTPKVRKIWIPTFDDDTRETHLSMSNHPAIGLDELFDVGDGKGAYPGDFALPAKESINCRCAIGYEYAEQPVAVEAPIATPAQPPVAMPTQPEDTEEEEKKKLRESILANNQKAFNQPNGQTYQKEFEDVLNSMSKNDLILYEKLSKIFPWNSYSYKVSGAHYSPMTKRVMMDLSWNTFEQHTNMNIKSGIRTKFHEEFHQLDDALSGTTLSRFRLTDRTEKIGGEMEDAIQEDVIDFINEAIEWANKKSGLKTPKITTLTAISDEAKDATADYLRTKYINREDKAAIAMFTDAIGGITEGQITRNSIAAGFWGHKDDYYQIKGKQAAGLEAWAEYGAYRFIYNDDTKKKIEKVMPKTINTMNKIYDQIVEYAKNNEIIINTP